jgi:hypothetical protein
MLRMDQQRAMGKAKGRLRLLLKKRQTRIWLMSEVSSKWRASGL